MWSATRRKRIPGRLGGRGLMLQLMVSILLSSIDFLNGLVISLRDMCNMLPKSVRRKEDTD